MLHVFFLAPDQQSVDCFISSARYGVGLEAEVSTPGTIIIYSNFLLLVFGVELSNKLSCIITLFNKQFSKISTIYLPYGKLICSSKRLLSTIVLV